MEKKMQLIDMIDKAQKLRLQLREQQARVESIQKELAQLDEQLMNSIDHEGKAFSELSEEEFQALMREFNSPDQITTEVVYATREKQLVKEIQLSRGASIEDGIMVSGILDVFPEIDLDSFKVGIYGTVKPLDQAIQEGDRIEIYRPVKASS
jgi:putative ubiquitin-RnfH superfamily antitoxin RatB of RatAB toxin-antitoxin module